MLVQLSDSNKALTKLEKVRKKMEKVKIAVIDLGTNSIRFDLYEVKGGLKVERVLRKKYMVRIGENVFQTKKLSIKAMDRTEKAILEFSEIIKEQNIQKVIAFSTCALREANNSKEFIAKIKDKFGINIKVITGKEEARLISKGILSNDVEMPKGLFALVDIGGGSTEVSFCYKRTALEQDSLPLGSSRLSQLFFTEFQSSSQLRKEARDYIKSVFLKSFPNKSLPPLSALVCSSGTAKAFMKLASAQGMPTQPLKLNDLSLILSDIKKLNKDELIAYPGMEIKRIDIIIAGGVLLKQMACLTGAKKLYYSEYNLRDGIITEQVESIIKCKLL